jgi:predicted Zn-dependent peptidase
LARKYFKSHLDSSVKTVAPRKGSGRVTATPGLELVSRDGEQVHLSLGVRTPGRGWQYRWALSVLNSALGGGLSSRLFQEIREQRGLVYAVYSTVDTFSDTGALSVYAGCSPERFDEVAKVTSQVLGSVVEGGFTAAEIERAKGALSGGLVLGLEDSASRMNRMGRSELNNGKHRTISATLDKIEAVTVDEVNGIARQLLSGRAGAAVVGPYRSKRTLPRALRTMIESAS